MGGIAFQMGEPFANLDVLTTLLNYLDPAAITIYVALAVEFIPRFLADRPVRKIEQLPGPRIFDLRTKLMLLGLSFSSLTIFIRYVLCLQRHMCEVSSS